MSEALKPLGKLRPVNAKAAREALGALGYQFSLRREGMTRLGSPDLQEFSNNQMTLIKAAETHRDVVLASLKFAAEFAEMSPQERADEILLKAALWDVIENGYAYYGRPGCEGEHIRQATMSVLEQMKRTAAREAVRTIGRPKNSY